MSGLIFIQVRFVKAFGAYIFGIVVVIYVGAYARAAYGVQR